MLGQSSVLDKDLAVAEVFHYNYQDFKNEAEKGTPKEPWKNATDQTEVSFSHTFSLCRKFLQNYTHNHSYFNAHPIHFLRKFISFLK